MTSTTTRASCASRPICKLGIEADFIAGREDRLATLLDAHDWDYVVGSVHFVGEHAVDHDGYEVWDHRSQRPDELWRRYFVTLGEAARCGLFDILAHPDLVKIWGPSRPVPEGDLRRFYELAMDGIAESQIAVELSTAGLRKPVGGALSGAGVPRDVHRRRLPGRAVQRRPRAGRRRARLRPRAGAARRARRARARGLRGAASGGWSRSGERSDPQRPRLGLAPLHGGAPADPRWRRVRAAPSSGSTVTPTPTSSRTP